jgi:general secretion pathway protein L
MHILAIDIGNYSIKISHSEFERKRYYTYALEEYILAEHIEDNSSEEVVYKEIFNIIKKYLSRINEQTRLIINFNSHHLTYRFIDLKIKNPKKALLMVPYQLEEDLPYTLSESHLATTLIPDNNFFKGMISIVRKKDFSTFFTNLKTLNISPYLVTSEISLYSSYFNIIKDVDNFCLIDMGYHSSRAYFFYQGNLVSTHRTYVAGKHATESIMIEYKLETKEANQFKHENAFMLTDNQYDKATKDQIHFAQLMDKLFTHLINEFNRWDLSYRVQFRKPISKILLTGGSSLIKNMDGYITSKSGVPTFYLDAINKEHLVDLDFSKKDLIVFNTCALLNYSYPSKKAYNHFLSGEFTLAGTNSLPFHSFAFVASRMTILSLIICFFLIIEIFVSYLDLKKTDQFLGGQLQNPLIELTPMMRRNFSKTPQAILSNLNNKKKEIVQSLNIIQSSIDINYFIPLMNVKNMIDFSKYQMIKFSTPTEMQIEFLIKAESPLLLKQLEDNLNSNRLFNWDIQINETELTMKVNGELKT